MSSSAPYTCSAPPLRFRWFCLAYLPGWLRCWQQKLSGRPAILHMTWVLSAMAECPALQHPCCTSTLSDIWLACRCCSRLASLWQPSTTLLTCTARASKALPSWGWQDRCGGHSTCCARSGFSDEPGGTRLGPGAGRPDSRPWPGGAGPLSPAPWLAFVVLGHRQVHRACLPETDTVQWGTGHCSSRPGEAWGMQSGSVAQGVCSPGGQATQSPSQLEGVHGNWTRPLVGCMQGDSTGCRLRQVGPLGSP